MRTADILMNVPGSSMRFCAFALVVWVPSSSTGLRRSICPFQQPLAHKRPCSLYVHRQELGLCTGRFEFHADGASLQAIGCVCQALPPIYSALALGCLLPAAHC